MAMPVDSISPVGKWEREEEEEREGEGEDLLSELPDSIRERLLALNQERYTCFLLCICVSLETVCTYSSCKVQTGMSALCNLTVSMYRIYTYGSRSSHRWRLPVDPLKLPGKCMCLYYVHSCIVYSEDVIKLTILDDVVQMMEDHVSHCSG